MSFPISPTMHSVQIKMVTFLSLADLTFWKWAGFLGVILLQNTFPKAQIHILICYPGLCCELPSSSILCTQSYFLGQQKEQPFIPLSVLASSYNCSELDIK